ncbi:MAG TPA: PQQ-dependent dehydrogenase, methanol/ethanol family, partial [Sphingomicrobium sp.]|nr:PQQ-dependent dehydrogenase, methanol/ethanol family [Sphingomicrobium sp.]
IPMTALAQTADELKNDDKTPGDVLTYGMGYSQHRFSPLTQINRQTVKRLVPAWSYSLADNRGLEGQALVKDGVVFLTDHEKTVAVDALTGREIWKTMIEYPPETTRVVCCGIVNRGAALFDGKLYRTTLDANVIALDAKSGKEVWRTKSSDPKDGYSMTVAPLVANGVVIAGVAGAEYGIRGYLEGFDAQTGKSLWRTYTIPEKGQPGSETWPGDTWKQGGGSTWITGSYDPDLDLVYWGTGNPAPWNPLNRKGDNLYTNSVLAFQPKTGKVVWHFQMTPGDPFDYDGVNEWILADLPVDGGTRKVVMHADRNGYLYVIERATGKLVAANAFVKVNWADGIDKETGRPVWSAETKAVVDKGEKQRIYPAVSGGKNWGPMAFDPTRRLLYINTNEWGMDYEPAPVEQVANLKAGQPHYGVKFPAAFEADKRGLLRATDPLTGKAKWELPFKSPNIAGVLATAGGLVFTGMLTGEFIAVDADTGKVVWQFQTPSGIVGQPITWEKDGKQYVTVTSGIGGVYALKMGDPNVAKVPAGGSLWTFKLFED